MTSGGAGRRATVAAVLLALGMVFWVPSAVADTAGIIAPSDPNNPQVDSGWQAGTCYADSPTCSVASPKSQFFEQAAGHPQVGFTQFITKHTTEEPLPGVVLEEPVGDIKTVRVDLPAGLSVNPQATPQCDQKTFETTPLSCPSGSEVGTSFATAALLGIVSPQLPATVYNIKPPDGEPARFGFNLLGNNVYLRAGVAWENDYHEFFTIDAPKSPIGHVLKNRLVFNGRAGNGTFITTPTTCFGESIQSSPFEHVYSTLLRADSFGEPDPSFPDGSSFFESKIPPGTSPKECSTVPYGPSISVNPNTAQADSPSGPTVDVKVPFEVPSAGEILQERTKQASSQTKQAKVTLPLGMGINPSAATGGLKTCTDTEFGKGSRKSVACPAASKIGIASINTPPLPDGSLSGTVYVGQQLSRDPTSGDEYRIFVDVESTRYGISARLVGNVSADPTTGQLTTTFDDKKLGGLPQVPFSSFSLDFDDGPHAVLTSPGACGPNKTTAVMTPWSGNPAATPSGDFSLSTAPKGGACAKSLGARPFKPSFAADTAKPAAGEFSPLHMNIVRTDGNQELKGVDVTLPPGLVAKLAGVKYCPANVLAAAAANSGAAEAADSSCPNSSMIGRADIVAGSGPSPLHVSGKVFLSGRYKGAPLSLAVITPATAGPFDLGTVVVRVALSLEPRTAQVHAVSDPVPHVYGGSLLDVRSVSVKLDRDNFTLNPTNCSKLSFDGALLGGGANPVDPAAFTRAPVSTPFEASGCDKLGFRPKLSLRLTGAMRRTKNPRLRAVLTPRPGDANIARAQTILPRSLILDQGNLANVCTRVQFAANDCPKDSIYGTAIAISPLLDDPLQGPVYLRSSNNTLPDLVPDLRGQVDVELDSRTDSSHGRIRNTFDIVPDVPVTKFVLTLRGGKRGLLVNSQNQCPRKKGHGGKGKGAQASKAHRGARGKRVIVRFKGQNGKQRNMRPRLLLSCGKKHKGTKKNK
jgi:hypothetical protein